MRSVAEADDYMQTLREMLVWLGICDGKMEEGSLRFEASMSVRRKGDEALGKRVEVKNLNSTKAVLKVLDHEHERQTAAIERGEALSQETRLWDEAAGVTRRMRSKEQAHDYRYFPEPDLAPIDIDEAWQERVRARIIELPVARRDRFVREHGLPPYDAGVLTSERAVADFFEATAAASGDAKAASNWIMNDLLGALKERGLSIADAKVTPGALASLIALVGEGKVSIATARQQVFPKMLDSGETAAAIVEREGLLRIGDEAALRALAERFVSESPDAVASFRAGKEKALQAILGKVMRETKGKADPKVAIDLIREAVEKAP
jgi:aspartyl-tRNA(Asn)/glutamyl-tRNA(Gln) amidotransferase subunit B